MCGKTRLAFHFREFATLLGKAVGRPVEYDHITYEQFEEGMTKHGVPQFLASSSFSKPQITSCKFKTIYNIFIYKKGSIK